VVKRVAALEGRAVRCSPLLATDQHLDFVHFVRPGKI
jgi:hypothetical protein